MRPVRFAVIGLTLLAAGCAAGGGGGDVGGRTQDRNLITIEDLAPYVGSGTAYDAVRRLRSNWLTGRGTSSAKVFVDGILMGDPTVLRDYQVADIREARFIPSADATMRWGTGYSGGAIEVTTR